MEAERTVSAAAVVVWVLWGVSALICLAGGIVVLIEGEHIWARAVGLALFGAEMLLVGAAAVTTAWMLLRRHTRRIDDRLELRDDIRRLRGMR